MSEIQEIAKILQGIKQPIFYINRPSIHMLGVEKYVPQLYSVRLRPLWQEGLESDPRTFIPDNTPERSLGHSDAVHWLLKNKQVQDFIAANTPAGLTPKIIVSVQDSETEIICAELGYDIAWIPNSEYKRLDSKFFGTHLSQQAGIKNVPNIIAQANSWRELKEQAEAAGLGHDLVVQTDYGEAGAGTYMVSSEEDFTQHSSHILAKTLKIMKRIEHRSLAMEAVILPGGIVLGPLLQEIVGHKEVAINPGSASGLEFYHDVLEQRPREEAQEMVLKYGEELIKEGYRGLYEVDILQDVHTGELFFGESNPRFTGCAMVSNAVTAELWGLPIYALNLYAFIGIEREVNVDAFNRTWDEVTPGHEWSNIILRHTKKNPEVAVNVPASGTYTFDGNFVPKFKQKGSDWFDLSEKNEFFLLSYREVSDVQVYGDEIATVYLRAPFQNRSGELTQESKALIAKILALYEMKELSFMKRATDSLARRFRALRS